MLMNIERLPTAEGRAGKGNGSERTNGLGDRNEKGTQKTDAYKCFTKADFLPHPNK